MQSLFTSSMSSSTVSITANPTGTPFRRHTLTGDKNPSSNSTDLDETDTSPATEEDPIRETDTSHPNTQIPLSPNYTTKWPKSRKRTVGKHRRSGLKTAVRVIVKNLIVVMMLVFFVHLIRGLSVNQGVGFDTVFNPRFEYERRILEIEEVVMTIEKLMQVQVDRLDRKVASVVSGSKSELIRRIDGDNDLFSNKFSEFDKRVKSVERSLKSSEWLSKDEFDRLVDDFRVKKAVGESTLDEIRAFAKGVVEDEIGKHAADGVGRVDYAVASGGGMVLRHSDGFGARRGGGWFGGVVRNDAVKMLQPSFGQPGECFAFEGDSGFVEVKLRSAIVPEAVTLEHVSKSVAFDRSTAPKDCKVWGWSRNKEDTHNEHLLTEFTYDLEKSSSQTFNVLLDTGVDPIIIDTVRLQFMSNHGSPTHTCVYRVRVHGHQPDAS